MNVPNILTAFRFILVPVFAYYLSTRNYVIAVVLFLLGGLTDILDGYIARKCNLVTSWGKIADPMADKLMQITAIVILSVVLNIVPIELLLIIMAKEMLMGIGALVLYKQNHYVVSANWYGKMATVIFYLAVVLLLFDEPFGRWTIMGFAFNQIFLFVTVLVALFAFFMYLNSYVKIKQQKSERS